MTESEPPDETDMALDEDVVLGAETTCCVCFAEFLDPEDLNIHISQVHANAIAKSKNCQFCLTTYTDSEDYALHIRDSHITEMKCCKFCTKVFVNSEKYRKHEKKHHSATKKYSCSQCPMFFGNLWNLESHEYTTHNNNHDGVMLQDCYSQLSSVFNIKAQTILKSLGMDTIYICTVCAHCTVDIESYVQHLREKNCRSFTCEKCSNVYKGKKALIRHLQAHKQCYICYKMEDKMAFCGKCHQDIPETQMKEHDRDCRVVKCSKCSYFFNNMEELSEHHAKDHPLSVEVTVCTFCRREFVGNMSMKKHIDRAHKDEFHLYKYKCVYCDAIFKHPQKLFSHFFIKHKDLEPYKCNICNTTFRLRKRFSIHIKLDHNSIGFVEFDNRYHVFFTDKKSQNPFNPTCVLPPEYGNEMLQPKIVKVVSEATGEITSELMKTQRGDVNEDTSLINVHSDFMSVTETEDNQTEIDTKQREENTLKQKRKIKPNLKRRVPKEKSQDELLYSSDDEPLLYLKKRVKKNTSVPKAKGNLRINRKNNKRKMKFTCNKCNKYCYTFQNYHNHMSSHSKNDIKKCIKCLKTFRNNNSLQKHMKTDHAKSKLTETLKNLLEKRKSGINIIKNKPNKELTMSEKFQTTVKRVTVDHFPAAAKITPIPNSGLSVQKFIENFTPDVTDSKETKVTSCITVKRSDNPYYRAPVIKLTKFKPEPYTQSSTKLAMPKKFKKTFDDKVKISMRIVQQPIRMSHFMEQKEQEESNVYEQEYNDYCEDMDTEDQYRNDSIPEVAQEVLLEGTEEPAYTKPIPHKIIIPKLTKDYKKVHIAHIIPTAPFFKITTVNDVFKTQTQAKKESAEDILKLPDGTKLVTANPLAHLLGDTDIEKVLQSNTNKYYKPRVKNFKGILAKALQDIDSKVYKRKPKKNNTVISIKQ